MKRHAHHLVALLAAACAFGFASAETWYVDASKPAGSGDGRSAATAFHTIQEAISAASTTSADTIMVAPGVYREGSTKVFSATRSGATVHGRVRVYIDRAVKLVATSKVRGETVILGDYGTDTEAGVAYDGKNGANAQIAYSSNCVQCVTLKNGAEGTELRGFTFKDGVIHQSLGGSSLGAGGVFRASPRLRASDFTVVNCDFVDCAGRGAGGMHGGTAINCRFTGCWNFNHEQGGAAALQVSAYNCIFSENGDRGQGGEKTPVVASAGTLVNCTLVNNYSRNGLRNYNSGTTSVYVNCANYDNSLTYVDTTSVSSNCVHDFTASIAVGANAADFGVVSHNRDSAVKTNLCVCPLRGDYRPVAGGRLDGTGDASGPYLAFIPEEFQGKDFDGNDIAAGKTPIGVALPAAEVRSGAFKMNTYFDVDGRAMAIYPQYVQSAVWPADMEVGVSHLRTDDAIGISWSSSFFYFGQYDTIRQLLPPASESPISVGLMTVTKTFYVGNAEGQSTASDSNAGTAAAPFETIQAAVNAVPSSASTTKYCRIIVRPGHYRTGGGPDPTSNAFNTRIVVPASTYVHIKADGGPENTFIHGAPDEDYLDAETYPGCGPKAYRCLYAPSSTRLCVSGFTFCDSYAPSRSTSATSAGAVQTVSSGTDSSQKIYDCVFTGNHGPSSCGNQAFFYRCLFTNNVDTGSYGIVLNSFLSACILANNNVNGNMLLGSKAHSFNCTVYEPSAPTTQYASHSVNYLINMAFAQGGWLVEPTDGTIAGCVINVKNDGVTAQGNVHEDPFIGAAWGDYRAKEGSSVFGAGTMTDPKGLVTNTIKMKHMRGDFYNKSLFSADGEVTSGAVAASRAERIVYADAENGSDATGDGLSEETAVKTLTAAAAIPCDGKIVALPGVYDEGSKACSGTAVHAGTPSLACRVIVPKNTTLVSRDGPESTFIVGAASADASADGKGLGRGPDAVRCAFLESGAVLRGFTVTGGRTAVKDDGYEDDAFGGGVLGRSRTDTLVENCIVSNNASSCGGGGAYTTFRNCRIEGNKTGYFGSVARHVSLYGCYIANNRGLNPIDVYYNVINCTYGEGNANISGSAAHMLNNGQSSSRVWNCVGLSNVSTGTMSEKNSDYRNCLFPKEANYSLGSNTNNVSFAYTLAELRAMFSGGVPKSKDAASVDAGTSDALARLTGDEDLAGNRRVANGAIDIGAYEYGWLSDYSAAIPRKLEVTEASSGVVLSGGKVMLSDGDDLVASATAADRRTISAVLSGDGVLTVYRNGEVLGTFSASGTLRFDDCAVGDEFRFSYASAAGGTAAITSCRNDAGLLMILR